MSLVGLKKAGQGWKYNQGDITYDALADTEGRAVTYNAVGSAVSLVGTDKISASLSGMKKSGGGWDYDQAGINYDSNKDPEGRDIFYNSLGTSTTLTGLTKNNA